MYVMESLSVTFLFIYAIQVFHKVFKNYFLIPQPKYPLFVHKKNTVELLLSTENITLNSYLNH